MPPQRMHEPWLMSREEQEQYSCHIGVRCSGRAHLASLLVLIGLKQALHSILTVCKSSRFGWEAAEALQPCMPAQPCEAVMMWLHTRRNASYLSGGCSCSMCYA